MNLVDKLLDALDAQEVEVISSVGREAIKAPSTFGKIVVRSAQLNMRDALSHACAKACRASLL